MPLCAYWDCTKEVEEGMSFCREHGIKLNNQQIDRCPKCGRYKDIRYDMCPDCKYGRPIADWKVSSRDLGSGTYVEPGSQEEPKAEYERARNLREWERSRAARTRGEATCPNCGSTNLTYKDVFDYFRCNDCGTTFITPVYTYEEQARRPGLESARAIAGELFGTTRAVQQEEQVVQAPRPEPAPVKEPPLGIIRKRQVEDRELYKIALGKGQQRGKLGWVYLAIVLAIVALAAFLAWIYFGEQINDALGGLFVGFVFRL
jgi:ribosomal protein L37AE/L43A